MTYKEFEKQDKEYREKIRLLKEEQKRLEQSYCIEAMEKAGYHIGDIVTNEKGEKGIIVGVELVARFYPRTIVAKMRKDGTRSQVTSYSLGFNIPNIKE
jgi:single-stranded DNA-specific DHH superfamily exonuclease